MTIATEAPAMLPALRAELATLKDKIEDCVHDTDRAMTAMRTRRTALEGKDRRVEDDKGWQTAKAQNLAAIAEKDRLVRLYDLVRMRAAETLRIIQQHQRRLDQVDAALSPWLGVIDHIDALESASIAVERGIGAAVTGAELSAAVTALRGVRHAVVNLPRRLLDERASLRAELDRLEGSARVA